MTFRTEGILTQAENLPTGESSINSAQREFSDEGAAAEFFARLKVGLLDVSHWNHKSGLSTFQLFDSSGQPTGDQKIKLGAFIEITLTGTGKSDWVTVDDIYEDVDELVITLRPTFDPTGIPQQTGKTSHFFWSKATNNFCALRSGNNVSLYVIGLNERLNSDHTSGVIETIRNTAVADVGYYLGVQKAEWSKFCSSFLFDGEEKPAR